MKSVVENNDFNRRGITTVTDAEQRLQPTTDGGLSVVAGECRLPFAVFHSISGRQWCRCSVNNRFRLGHASKRADRVQSSPPLNLPLHRFRDTFPQVSASHPNCTPLGPFIRNRTIPSQLMTIANSLYSFPAFCFLSLLECLEHPTDALRPDRSVCAHHLPPFTMSSPICLGTAER